MAKSFHQSRFAKGSGVRITDRSALDTSRMEWHSHHPLAEVRLGPAGRAGTIASVGFRHGGEGFYAVHGVPGTWHERGAEEAP
jgi:hypothetical protein